MLLFRYLVLILVLSYSSTAFAYLEDKNKDSCQSLGYNTLVSDCLNAKMIPLLCPFANSGEARCLCMNKSCRGYDLKLSDLDVVASDGKKYKDHIKTLSSCTVGFGEDALELYRVDECMEGSLFQNGLCDVGCDKINKYPYTIHPGNLAGNVISCVDSNGEYYGYDSCNDGWTFSSGKCNLASCSIYDYPYNSNPNLINNTNRGEIKTCKIGGNTYYRYTATDKNNKPLTSGGCENNGYNLLNGVCSKYCYIDNCSATIKTVTYTDSKGVTYSTNYNEWSCKITTNDCRVGDFAVFNNQAVGVIYHVPNNEINKMFIVSDYSYSSGAWASGQATTVDTPILNSDSKTYYDGKYNTNILVNFAKSNSAYTYPTASIAYNYTPSNCNHDICKKGEWYLPSLGETVMLINSKYILYNTHSYRSFWYDSSYLWSSQEAYYENAYLRNLNGATYNWPKTIVFQSIPVISFTAK